MSYYTRRNALIALLDPRPLGRPPVIDTALRGMRHLARKEGRMFAAYKTGGRIAARADALREALEKCTEAVTDWGSGTRIGASLKEFNDLYGKRALSRESNVSARKLLLRATELEPTLERRFLAARAASPSRTIFRSE